MSIGNLHSLCQQRGQLDCGSRIIAIHSMIRSEIRSEICSVIHSIMRKRYW
jgi:hypothetical protein